MLKRLASLCLVLTCLAAGEIPPGGRVFHSDANGYSVTLPEGWFEVPREALDELARAGRSGSAPDVTWEAGYQAHPGPPWFATPYVLLQGETYKAGREPTELELSQLVRLQTGIDAAKVVRDSNAPAATQRVTGVTPGIATWDQPTHTLAQTTEMNLRGAGPVTAWTFTHFGRVGVAKILCYSDPSENADNAPTAAAINASFRFDPDRAYDPKLSPNVRPQGWLGRNGRLWLCVALGVCIAALLFRLVRKEKARASTDDKRS